MHPKKNPVYTVSIIVLSVAAACMMHIDVVMQKLCNPYMGVIELP